MKAYEYSYLDVYEEYNDKSSKKQLIGLQIHILDIIFF